MGIDDETRLCRARIGDHVMNKKCVAFARLVVCLALAGPASAAAQSDVIGSARAAVERGQRAEALTSLEEHLGAAPGDVDARLLYGLILSWEGRYDEARRELHAVLVQAPAYDDARVALMNVAWWSGASGEARDAADAVLSRDPGKSAGEGGSRDGSMRRTGHGGPDSSTRSIRSATAAMPGMNTPRPSPD